MFSFSRQQVIDTEAVRKQKTISHFGVFQSAGFYASTEGLLQLHFDHFGVDAEFVSGRDVLENGLAGRSVVFLERLDGSHNHLQVGRM